MSDFIVLNSAHSEEWDAYLNQMDCKDIYFSADFFGCLRMMIINRQNCLFLSRVRSSSFILTYFAPLAIFQQSSSWDLKENGMTSAHLMDTGADI